MRALAAVANHSHRAREGGPFNRSAARGDGARARHRLQHDRLG